MKIETDYEKEKSNGSTRKTSRRMKEMQIKTGKTIMFSMRDNYLKIESYPVVFSNL